MRSTEVPVINRRSRHEIEIVVDRIVVNESRSRIADSVEAALSIGEGVIQVAVPRDGRTRRTLARSFSTANTWRANSADAVLNADASQFFVQQPTGLVHRLRGIGTQVGANPKVVMSDPELITEPGRDSPCGPI